MAQSLVCSTPTSDNAIKANFLFGTANIYNPTAMIRHSFLHEKGIRWNPTFRVPDWEFWVQAMFLGARFANLGEVVLRYRGHKNQETDNISHLRNEFAPIRLKVLELFYLELTLEERMTVEPVLQWCAPPPLPVAQFEAALVIMDKLLAYHQQSRVRENREVLRKSIEKRRNDMQKALDSHLKKHHHTS